MAVDYDALYRRIWREILAQGGRLEEAALPFAERMARAIEAEGWALGPESEQAIADYLAGMEAEIKAGITGAIKVAAGAGVLHSTEVRAMAEEAFTRRWPDGLNLSRRLWAWNRDMRDQVLRTLAAGVRQGRAVNGLVMDMQRAIERAGTKFEIASIEWEDWAADLAGLGRQVIGGQASREVWLKAMAETRRHIEELRETGTKHAAKRAFSQIQKAVAAGRTDQLGAALKWWGYDKQLYYLKRIARTEMATAAHRAVIASTVEDEDIIGYRWRLSASHPAPDICDYYASVEMGLGKGVWTKEAVPHEKAHPFCMCTLTPRVRPIKEKGAATYAEFLRKSTPERQAQLMPKWANGLRELGVPLERLVRPDGLGLLTREALAERMGDRLKPALAVGRSLIDRDWGRPAVDVRSSWGRATVAALAAHTEDPVAKRLAAALQSGPRKVPVDGMDLHYAVRRYMDGEPLKRPSDLNPIFAGVVANPRSRIFRQQSQYFPIHK